MAKILLVEDNTSLRRTLRTQLESFGHQPTAVADGEAALQAAREGGFALAVIDIGIPGPSGLSVLKSLRSEGLELPIIIISGGLPGASLEQALALADLRGADGFLFKPIAGQELQEMVDDLLSA